MSNSNFIDHVVVFTRSGNGGGGSAHLFRDKLTAKGGPDGGDGVLHPERLCQLAGHGTR